MNTTTQEQTAKRYGVPNPESCKGLLNDAIFYEDDYPKTYWVWLKLKNDDEWFLSSLEATEQYYAGYSEDRVEYCYPAPQMHEIAVLLPNFIEGNDLYLEINKNSIVYTDEYDDTIHEVRIIDCHFAEAYAEMYLKLKGEKLI